MKPATMPLRLRLEAARVDLQALETNLRRLGLLAEAGAAYLDVMQGVVISRDEMQDMFEMIAEQKREAQAGVQIMADLLDALGRDFATRPAEEKSPAC